MTPKQKKAFFLETIKYFGSIGIHMTSAKKVLNMFKPDKRPGSQTPQGAAGFDNARENIDPHVKTQVLSTREISGPVTIRGDMTIDDGDLQLDNLKFLKLGSAGLYENATNDIQYYCNSGRLLVSVPGVADGDLMIMSSSSVSYVSMKVTDTKTLTITMFSAMFGSDPRIVFTDTGNYHDTDYMFDGYVRIGSTTTPTARLDVTGSAKFSSTVTIEGTTTITNSAQFDSNATAAETRMLLYDVDNATLERVSVGAADSGGVGFKVLRIPN